MNKDLPALGLDIGGKRTGVAISDPSRTIASPLDTVLTAELLPYVARQLEQGVEYIVVGHARQMDGNPSESEPIIQSVVDQIKRRWPELKIHRQDERFTSAISSRLLVELNVPRQKRRDKGLIDQMSAALILQDFIDRDRK